jgi:tetratricopeptide (TPR) repeat protein/tRNA A-37 threonylcarbamoyl transferase component Bud32
MGVVYAAFDPELSRKLAIKVLHPTSNAETARARLAREAQALARLSHPNVVQIYDVGTHERSVYVAMEFAEGKTLRDWLAVARPWRRVLAVMLQVGRGLAAAHRGGIVHRDVKPDNVIIGGDDETSLVVRVVDFGLACGASDVDDDALRSTTSAKADLAALHEDVSISDSLGERMTRTGARLGTPAYMAPEQWIGGRVDARTDQFAFCVTTWEALYGVRPFVGEGMAALGFAITHGQIGGAPSGTDVPAWIHRLLVRGLQVDPAERHADMDALTGALAHDPAIARRRVGTGALAVAAIGGAVWVGTTLGAADPPAGEVDPCAAADEAIGEVWDQAHREAVGQALRATSRSYSEDTAVRVDALVSAWVERFVAQRRDACRATHVRHEQSDEALDLRIACLDRERLELAALVEVLSTADATVLDRAVRSAELLPDPNDCASVDALRGAAMEPDDDEDRQEVIAIRKELARARALEQAARQKDADAVVEPLLARAQAVGWPPLVAEVNELRGILALDRAQGPEGAASLRAAYLAAVSGRHPRLAWSSATWLAQAEAMVPGKLDAAREWIDIARAQWTHARLGAEEEALVENAAFRVEAAAGEYQAARRHIERTIALREGTGDNAELAGAIANLGAVAGMLGDEETAVRELQRAIAMRERVQSPRHPDVGRDVHNLGSMLAQVRRFDEAAPLLERALTIKREVLGAEHPDVAYSLVSLGLVSMSVGKIDAAEGYFTEALAIQEKALGADHPDLGYSLLGLAECEMARERPREALPLLRRALAVRESSQPHDHPEIGPIVHMMGVAQLDSGDAQAAIASLERARAMRRESHEPLDRGSTTWALARARDATGDRATAIALAEAARPDLVAAGELGADDLAALDAWLAARRR